MHCEGFNVTLCIKCYQPFHLDADIFKTNKHIPCTIIATKQTKKLTCSHLCNNTTIFITKFNKL